MKHPKATSDELDGQYELVFRQLAVIDTARRSATRSVNAVMTAPYWLIGRYVEFEQSGEDRLERILQTASEKPLSPAAQQADPAILQTVSGKSSGAALIALLRRSRSC